MHLLNEIVVAILEDLGCSDLKSERLVCKTWCSCASTFLFDRIFVAPNKVDLEVFDAITRHPNLSKCVRHLIYDGTEFMFDLTKKDYIKSLWSQTWNQKSQTFLIGAYTRLSDPQIKDWIDDVNSRNLSPPTILAKWEDYSFINRGYEVYQEHSIYQHETFRSGDFVEPRPRAFKTCQPQICGFGRGLVLR